MVEKEVEEKVASWMCIVSIFVEKWRNAVHRFEEFVYGGEKCLRVVAARLDDKGVVGSACAVVLLLV